MPSLVFVPFIVLLLLWRLPCLGNNDPKLFFKLVSVHNEDDGGSGDERYPGEWRMVHVVANFFQSVRACARLSGNKRGRDGDEEYVKHFRGKRSPAPTQAILPRRWEMKNSHPSTEIVPYTAFCILPSIELQTVVAVLADMCG